MQMCWEWSVLFLSRLRLRLTVNSLITTSRHNHTQWRCGQSPRCYLVVPHADIGPDVIIDYRLLFIFRLQRHKITFFGGDEKVMSNMFHSLHVMTVARRAAAQRLSRSKYTQDAKSAAPCLCLHKCNHYRLASCLMTHSWMSNQCTSFIKHN